MTGVHLPGVNELPPGPRRDLAIALHALYRAAGMPSTRDLANAIKGRSDLPGTLSREGVSAALRGTINLPRWPNLESLVRVLAQRAAEQVDVEAETIRIQGLWLAASAGEASHPAAQKLASDPLASRIALALKYAPIENKVMQPLLDSRRDLSIDIDKYVRLEEEFGISYLEMVEEDGDADFLARESIAFNYCTCHTFEVLLLGLHGKPPPGCDKTPSPLSLLIAVNSVPAPELALSIRDKRLSVTEAETIDIDTCVIILGGSLGVDTLLQLIRELGLLGCDDYAWLVLWGIACRNPERITEIMPALYAGLSHDAFGVICDSISRGSIESLGEVLLRLNEAGLNEPIRRILWSAAHWSPVQRVPALLTILRDSGLEDMAKEFIRSVAWLAADKLVAVASALTSTGRQRAAEQILNNVANTTPERASQVVLSLRRAECDQLADLVLDGSRSLKIRDRAGLADALERIGLGADAAKVRPGVNPEHA
jgi:hypothetical protein